MGSKNCAETPRQRMIGMMYLFLTAMLALNVSSEVLNGFVKVDESLRKSAENFQARNKDVYNEFSYKEELNKTKVEQWHNFAKEVGVLSDTLYNQMQGYKLDIVHDVDGPDGDPDSIGAKDNLDGPTRVMLSKGKNSKGILLKESINDFRKDLVEIMENAVKINGGKIDESLLASLENTLSTPDMKGKNGEKKDWEHAYFAEMPTAASIALISKLQNDVRDAESQVIQFLLRQIDAKDFKVNKIEAHLIPTSTTIIKGGKFSAKILLAGVDTTKVPEYELKDNNQAVSVDEKGTYEVICNSVGLHTLEGIVYREDDDGNKTPNKLPIIKYEVIEPFATVSATKMNVLYAGVENPISISVPGVAASDLRPTSLNGSLKEAGDGQGYIAVPKDYNREAIIRVNAIMEGEERFIADYPFRVKLLPDPLPFIHYEEVAADASGKINRISKTTNKTEIEFRLLKYFKGIKAELPDSDFEVKYDVLSFRIVMINDNGNNKSVNVDGGSFNVETLDFLKEFKGVITITEVKAKGPDGIPRNLPPIVTQVK